MGKRDRRRVVTGSGAHETRLGPGDEPLEGAPEDAGSRAAEPEASPQPSEAPPEVTPSRRRLTPGSGDAATVSIVAPGQILNDHYRLLREIARGGMGIVYEAEDVKIAGRRVAVKVLPPEVAKDRSAVVRLQREAAAVCTLDHPAIVRLIELNADGDTHYLVMEYLNGDDLAFHLATNERLPLDEVLDVARQVCPALVHAHGKGVLHRDIKPANLMFKLDGEHRQAKITDFGIASQVKDSMTRLTGQDSAGTLLYIAPEQLRGTKASAASDQYSLAVTLYELLSGEPPFTGGGLSHQILEAKPAALEGVPAHVNDAIMRALSKEPEGRFADCGAFLAALEGRGAVGAAVAGGTVSAGGAVPTGGAASAGGAPSAGGRASAGGVVPAGMAEAASGSRATSGGAGGASRDGARLAVTVLVLLAVALVGWGLGLRSGAGSPGGSVAAVTAAPSPAPSPTPSPTPALGITSVPGPTTVAVSPTPVVATPSAVAAGSVTEPNVDATTPPRVTASAFVAGANVPASPTPSPVVPTAVVTTSISAAPTPPPVVPMPPVTASISVAGATVPTPPTPPPVPRTVRVSFESDPPGAKVFGVELPPERKSLGRTGEGEVAVDLEPGTWTFKFILAGHRDVVRTVEVAPGDRPQTVHETLVDRHGFIDVTVEPADAEVMLDGTTCAVAGGRGRLRVVPGRHVVIATLEGHEDAAATVSVVDGATVSSRLVLREKPKGPPVPPSGRVGDTWTNSIGMRFSWCPPGEFNMGGSDGVAVRFEGPVHRVRIPRGFWLGTYEVTQGEWQAVLGANPAKFTGDDRRPVEQVSWSDCQEFLRRLAGTDGNGYRLPSEAEWEYACRAGTTGARYGDLDAVAWYEKNSGETTHRVGGKRPNAWGAYDMLGNVWEWCQDTWHDTYTGAPADGSAWEGGSDRVLRGGSWVRQDWTARAASRCFDPDIRIDDYGLRVVAVPGGR